MEGHAVVAATPHASEAELSVNAALATLVGSKRWLSQTRIRAFLLGYHRFSLGYETS
jgi:hypothetical protein